MSAWGADWPHPDSSNAVQRIADRNSLSLVVATRFIELLGKRGLPRGRALALGLVALDRRFPHAAWRAFASLAIGLSALAAFASIQLLLDEAPAWNAWLVVGAGLALPAALTAGVTWLNKSAASLTSTVGKIASIALCALAVDMSIRLLFSDGAVLLQPIGFVEAGFHIAAWLAIALVIAARRGAVTTDHAAVMVIGAAAVGAGAVSALLWLTPYWDTLIPARASAPWLHFDGLGFAAPAVLFWVHWAFWRARGSRMRTRVALGAAALLSACFVTLEMLHPVQGAPDAFAALICTLSFATAIGINFAPGVVARKRSHL